MNGGVSFTDRASLLKGGPRGSAVSVKEVKVLTQVVLRNAVWRGKRLTDLADHPSDSELPIGAINTGWRAASKVNASHNPQTRPIGGICLPGDDVRVSADTLT
jgi:hypothetical protein